MAYRRQAWRHCRPRRHTRTRGARTFLIEAVFACFHRRTLAGAGIPLGLRVLRLSPSRWYSGAEAEANSRSSHTPAVGQNDVARAARADSRPRRRAVCRHGDSGDGDYLSSTDPVSRGLKLWRVTRQAGSGDKRLISEQAKAQVVRLRGISPGSWGAWGHDSAPGAEIIDVPSIRAVRPCVRRRGLIEELYRHRHSWRMRR